MYIAKEEYKEKDPKKLLIIIGCALAGLLVVLYLLMAYTVRPLKDISFEAGDPVTLSKNNVLGGPAIFKGFTKINADGFDPMTVGEYPITIRHCHVKYDAVAKVIDTKAPVLYTTGKTIYVGAGVTTPIDSLFSVIDDASEVTFTAENPNGGVFKNNITILDLGNYSLKVTGTDIAGNSTDYTLGITVDTAPVISGMKDYYVTPGCEIDYLNGISAIDEVDGDVSSTLSYDASELNLDEIGTYTYTVSAKDRFGIVVTEPVNVNVVDPDELQQMVNNHTVNATDQHLKGAKNVYDFGVYEEDNVDRIVKKAKACAVAICYTGKYSFSRGSGFIIKITDDDVIVFTNSHVLVDDNPLVEFYNGSRVRGEILNQTGEQGEEDGDAAMDMGLVRVPISQIPDGILEELRTVHINQKYWTEIKDNEPLELCVRLLKDSSGVLDGDKISGTMIHKFAMDPYFKGKFGNMTQVEMPIYPGTSGSAILDGHGNLIAMVTLATYVSSKPHYYGVPLNNILSFYADTMGEQAYYE